MIAVPRLSIEAAATWWARRSGTPKPHRATLIRWATRGVRGIRLPAERVGGRWYVTEAGLLEFHRRLNSRPEVPPPAGAIRAAEIAAAQRELEAILGGGGHEA